MLIYRPVGKGLVVVTSYFRFMGESKGGQALLGNSLVLAAAARQGVQLVSFALPDAALGANRAVLKVRNLLDRPASLAARLALAGKEPLAPVTVERTVAAGGEAEFVVPFTLPARGAYQGTWELLKDGASLFAAPCALAVPELLTVGVRSRHQYCHYGKVTARLGLAPELAGRLKQLSVEVRLVGPQGSSERLRVAPGALDFEQALTLTGLAPGRYRLLATLSHGEERLARASARVLLHPEPTVKFNDRNVCYVKGQPFFPIGMYHVAWSASKEQMLKCLDDRSGQPR